MIPIQWLLLMCMTHGVYLGSNSAFKIRLLVPYVEVVNKIGSDKAGFGELPDPKLRDHDPDCGISRYYS